MECKFPFTCTFISDCQDGSFGTNCSEACQCDPDHSSSQVCNTVNGSCYCNTGWMGYNCSENINECDGDPCPEHSMCDDTPGSYTCTCDIGYTFNDSQLCEGNM